MRLTVTLTSDFICPWCLIGEQRLRKAVESLPPDVTVDVAWRPFELNPDMPPQGWERKAYRVAKFGSLERSQAMDARIAAIGRSEGVAFNFDKISRTPNTFAAHRLMWLAKQEGDPERLAGLLFKGYFGDGRDLADTAVLTGIAIEAGLAASRVEAFLESDESMAETRALEAQAYRSGVTGVPFFQIGDHAIVGAQSPAIIADALRRKAKLEPASIV